MTIAHAVQRRVRFLVLAATLAPGAGLLPAGAGGPRLQGLLGLREGPPAGGLGVRLHASGQALERLAARAPRYVFGISTGHAGSTSLSTWRSYKGEALRNVLFDFEGAQYKEWWDQRPSEQEQIRKVTTYKAGIDVRLARDNSTTFVDLGHHILHGIWQVAPTVFGDGVFFVRFRRARIATARSFMAYNRGLCDDMYRICPLIHDYVLSPSSEGWDEAKWSDLSFFQQHLWFVDEVEAEFQLFLRRHPNVSYLECNWSDDLMPCFRAVSEVLGVEVKGSGTHGMAHARGVATADELRDYESQNELYRSNMNFYPRLRSLIAAVQF